MSSQSSQTPWWLEPGAQDCPFCLHSYHYEAGYHCIDCDQPVCPGCVIEVRKTHRVVCPECHTGDE